MQHKSVIGPSFPRLVGSLLVSVSLLSQTFPASGQTGPAKPAAAPTAAPAAPPVSASSVPAAAPAAPPGTPSAATPPSDASAPAPAAAASPEAAEAEAALEQGRAAYRAGDYASAEQWFDKAGKLQPSASAQYWKAMAIDLQGRVADAVTAYSELFANPDVAQVDAELLSSARQRYELLNKIPATVLLNVTPADSQVAVDGQLQTGASPYVLKLSAGAHSLRVTRDGYTPLEAQIDLKGAQSTEQTVQLSPAAAAPAAPVSETSSQAEPRSKVPAYVTLGVAGVAAGLGTVFGIQALGAKSDYDKSPTAATADDVERNALIADMAWGIAITLGITGTVLLLSDEPADTEKVARPWVVAPYVSNRGAGAAAQMTF